MDTTTIETVIAGETIGIGDWMKVNLLWWTLEPEEPDLWELIPEPRIGFYNNRLSMTLYHPLYHPNNVPWSKVVCIHSVTVHLTKHHGKYADDYDQYEGLQYVQSYR